MYNLLGRIYCEGVVMNKYVVGFAFSENLRAVLLIQKNHPDWQKGFLNGIGGKIEPKEKPLDAMHRECQEETGLGLVWIHRGVMCGTNNDGSEFECHIFYAYSDKIFKFQQKETEKLGIYFINHLHMEKTIANVKALIQFGLCSDHCNFITMEYGE